MDSFSYLPKELLEDIMSRLPPNSLVRAKCLSKSWNTVISDFVNDPEFVARHLQNMKNKPSTSLVFRYRRGQFSLLTLYNDDGSEDHICSFSKDFYLPILRGEACQGAYHCDGIVCVVKDFSTIMLCNPAFQEFKLLPESSIKVVMPFCMGMGFGYDLRAKDYKLVRILRSRNILAEVYTLGTNSWKEINVSQDINICFENRSALYWRGVCYWVMYDSNDEDKDKILCFDMCSEEFRIIPGPYEIELEADWMGLFVWNDSLALFLSSKAHDPWSASSSPSSSSSESDSNNLDPAIIEICVLDNCFGAEGINGACSWTKSVYMTPPINVVNALTFLKGDEFLIKDSHGQLVSYNIRTKKLRNIAIHGVGQNQIGNWACSYVESLVSVRWRR